MLFVSSEDKKDKLGRLHHAVLDLEKMESVQVNLLWKSFQDLPLLDDEQFEKLFPIGQDGTALGICNRCTHMINQDELVGFCR